MSTAAMEPNKLVTFSNSTKNVVDFDDDVSLMSHESTHMEGETEEPTSSSNTQRNKKNSSLLLPRITAIGIFLLVGAGLSVALFMLMSSREDDTLDAQLDLLADEIEFSSDESFKHIEGLLGALSASMTAISLQEESPPNSSPSVVWPFYYHTDFAVVGSKFLEKSGATIVSWSPVVNSNTTSLDEWEQYSSTELGLDYIKPINPKKEQSNSSSTILPIWQMVSDSNHISSNLNFDLLTNNIIKPTIEDVIANSVLSLSDFVDAQEMFGFYGVSSVPESLMMVPIHNDFASKQVVGILMAAVPWEWYFASIFHETNPKIYAVVSDGECGNEFTLEITGPDVTYLGEGDLHSHEFHQYERFRTFSPGIPTECEFTFRLYPSQELYDEFQTSDPTLWLAIIVAITVIFSIIFVGHDVYTRKREQEVISSAARSNAIVSALFPVEVRDRLFGKDKKASTSNITRGIPESSKFRLKNYLAKESDSSSLPAASNEANHFDISTRTAESTLSEYSFENKPIADLFPNTTIMFADIAGFTAWSSVREPSQVFILLETVYHAFDVIAKRRRVFKVETVGDCYVAVTGLPVARKDHAVVMARFARECLEKFNSLSKQLEISLGPDTGDLAMRAGLHSGPVTAGVLRGDKSRFQLFGDTVNTAARIESTGQRNRVHISAETAKLLQIAGKESWVKKRSDKVAAKGKGPIQTYWLHDPYEKLDTPKEKEGLRAGLISSTSIAMSNAELEQLEKSLPPKILRLVSWNVEILKKLLQQVIAKRQGQQGRKWNQGQLEKREKELVKHTQCLEEVTEIIALPKYDSRAHQYQAEAHKIIIPEDVVNELRHYVCKIALLHQDNHFHNFEHASHVTMSVSKLLSRIVAPDEVINGEYGNDLAMSLHDHTYGITSDPLTQFSVVLAALIHDVDHSGVSNFQLIKENTKIASIFKNKSVAEQNSIVLAWDLLMMQRYSTLRRCIYSDLSELDRFRQILINNVLATDIFDKELQGLRKNRWENAFQRYPSKNFSSRDDVNRKATIVMEHLIQASDVAHTMQHWHIYQKWNERLFAEMLTAYHNGRMENDPTKGWYQGELNFFDNYIIPLAKKLKECGVFGVSCDEYLNYALENRREWASKGEETVERMIQKYASTETEVTTTTAKPNQAQQPKQ